MEEAPAQGERDPWTFEPLVLSILGIVLLWNMMRSTGFVRELPSFDVGAMIYAVMVGVGFGMTLPAVRVSRGWWRFWATVLLGVSVGLVGMLFVLWGGMAWG